MTCFVSGQELIRSSVTPNLPNSCCLVKRSPGGLILRCVAQRIALWGSLISGFSPTCRTAQKRLSFVSVKMISVFQD